jgi:peptide/nickel transport system substrate-binding protein
METGSDPRVTAPRTVRRVTSRRSLLKGMTALMAVGVIAPLAAACSQPAAPAKPADTKPAAPAATTAPAAAKPAESKPAEAAKPAAPAAPAAAAPAKPAAGGEPKKGGTLKWAVIGEPPALDPTFTTATVTANFGWHVFEGLFTRNAAQAPHMDLLEKYEPSSDGKKVTMTLRKGVMFHNDKELTSADVDASLKRYADLAPRGKLIFGALDSMESPDKYTVVMNFKEPRAGILPVFLSRNDPIIIPAEDAVKYGKDKITQPIGTGPFKFVEHQPDRMIRMQRFDKYVAREDPANGPAGKKVAYLDEIQYIPVPEESVRADGVGTGEYHYGDSLAPDSYARVKGVPNVEADIGKPYYWAVAHMNKKEGLFTNVKLRQAVLAAMQVEPIAAAAFGVPEFYRIDPGIAAPETTWFTDEGKDVFNKQDIAKAKALLQEANYDGTPIRWMATKEYFYNYNAGVVFKQQLEAAGFKVDLQVMDWATLVKRRSDSKEYDVFVTAHESYSHPILQPFMGETWPGWWVNTDKNDISAKMMAETDPAKQMDLIKQLQRLFYTEVPGVKYGEYFALRARSTKVLGTQNPSDPFFWNAWLA